MSRFTTAIPVNIDEVKKLLPNRAYLHGARFEGNEVIIDWETDDVTTGFTFPVPFPVENLRAKRLPDGARFVDKTKAQPKTAQNAQPLTLKNKVDSAVKKADKPKK